MKLLNLHIDNFGKLHNYDYSFQSGINTICEENGSGKTTLGTFIKVMFYGFEGETKKKADRERKKYEPWQGGAYGGFITFEVNGKSYKLQRSFKKKASEDKCVLKDELTNLESKDFDVNNIGKQLFQIDAGSFARTMFISQNDYNFESFNDIDTKMGNLVDNTDDINNFDSANKSIDNALSEISKSRGKGKIFEHKNELKDLENDVRSKNTIESSIKTVEDNLSKKNHEIHEKKLEIDKLESKINHIASVKEKVGKKVEYDGVLKTYSDAKRGYDEAKSYFPGEIPNGEELNHYRDKAKNISIYNHTKENNVLSDNDYKCLQEYEEKYAEVNISEEKFKNVEVKINQLNSHKNTINNLQLTYDELEDFEKLKKVFSIGFDANKNDEIEKNWSVVRKDLQEDIQSHSLSVNDKQKLEGYESKFNQTSINQQQLRNLKESWSVTRANSITSINSKQLSNSEMNHYEELKKFFGMNPYDEQIANNIQNDWKRRNDLVRELNNKKEKLRNEALIKQSSRNNSPLMFIGIALIMIGIVLFIVKPDLMIGGIVADGIGLILLIVPFVSGRKNDNANSQIDLSTLDDDNKQIQQLENSVKDYLEKYNQRFDVENVQYSLDKIKDNGNAYKRLEDSILEFEKTKNEKMEIVKPIEAKVRNLFNEFDIQFIEESVNYQIDTLIRNFEEYTILLDRKKCYESNKEEKEREIKEIEDKTLEYLKRYYDDLTIDDYVILIKNIKTMYGKYCRLTDKSNNTELLSARESFDELNADIKSFFKYVGEEDLQPGQYYQRFNAIKEDVKRRDELKKRKKAFESADNNVKETESSIREFLQCYSFIPKEDLVQQLDDIQDKLLIYSQKVNPYKNSVLVKEEFEKKNPDYEELANFKDPYDDNELTKSQESHKELIDQLDSLKKEFDDIDEKLNELNDNYNEICDKEGRISVLKEVIQVMEERKAYLEKTKDFLSEAKNLLNAKYTAPLKNGIDKYFNILGKNADFKVEINVKKEIIINANGVDHGEKVLSQGYKDAVDICFRFGLIDAMYKNEKPIIILDDPFINLDSEKVEIGLNMLKDIAKEYQILYLTCHNSRNIVDLN